jgi:uncharacterized membrane protein
MTMPSSAAEPGRATAFVVYVLYLLSIPSFAIFALVGVIIALAGRDGAGPVARSHLEDQVRIWFVAFWWAVALAILWVLGAVLVLAFGLGLLVWWLIGIIAFVVMLWFTIKSLLGLLALMDNRPR